MPEPETECIPLAADLFLWHRPAPAPNAPRNALATDVLAVLTGERRTIYGPVQFTGPAHTELPETWARFLAMHNPRV